MPSPQTSEIPPYAGVSVKITRGGGASTTCEVQRTTPRGITVQLAGVFDIAIGEVVGLEIQDPLGPQGEDATRTVGKVMEVFLQGHATTIRLALEHPTPSDEAAYVAIVERRGGVRHPVPPTFPCRATLMAPELDGGIAARIYDVSGNSLGVAIDAADERALARCVRIEVEISLSGLDHALRVPCLVRRRTIRGRTGVDVGCQVDESSSDHQTAMAALLELIELVRSGS